MEMGGFSNVENNASIRGDIMRCLAKGYHFALPVKTLSNKMMSCGLIDTPDISDQLYYLEQNDLIKFSNKSNSLNVLNNDAVVRLTANGIRFIENGGNPEMGIDL